MEEDSVTLSFNLVQPVDFLIGDYIIDDIFGLFYITESPSLPEYNVSNGAYKYQIRFDREYIGWKNILFQMTYDSVIRKETDWVLTDYLERHVQEIIKNLAILGKTYRYCIDGTTIVHYSNGVFASSQNEEFPIQSRFEPAEDLNSAKSISYSGTNIYDAIKTGICEAYKCEFWVNDDVLCLGKCEMGTSEDAIDFSSKDIDSDWLDFYTSDNKDFHDADDRDFLVPGSTSETNVQKIRPSRNTSEYANRLYVFGSTKNLPYSYRKKLVFTVNAVAEGRFRDSNFMLYPQMVQGASLDRDETPSFVSGKSIEDGAEVDNPNYALSKVISVINGESVTIIPHDPEPEPDKEPETTSEEDADDDPQEEEHIKYSVYETDGSTYTRISSEEEEGNFYFYVSSRATGFVILTSVDNGSKTKFSVSIDGNTSVPIHVIYNNTTYSATYYAQENGGWIGMSPTLSVGDKFSVQESDLVITAIKQSYYTSDYGDPSTLSHIGEQRLMLPSPMAYIGDDNIPTNKLVEKVVFFENVFPRCALRIAHITKVVGKNTVETHDDGSTTRYTVTKYTIKVRRISGTTNVNFPFDYTMLLSTEKLQIKFLTREEEKAYTGGVYASNSHHALAGMTFDVKWNQTDQSFTIVWNNDYGAQLPSESLPPEVDDSLILTGWNVKAMSTLGLIDSAEQELLTNGRRYLNALNECQFTFDCDMMSGWRQGVLPFGQRVCVVNNYIPRGRYLSRVIGYELKLDIPEDTPTYTVGDTEAYSRLRELQKSLQASEGNVSTSGDPDSAYSSSGGSGGGTDMLTVWKSLTNDEGIRDYSDTTEIDENHIPLLSVSKIAGLEDLIKKMQVWQIQEDKSVKLNPLYKGAWAEGYISAGGKRPNQEGEEGIDLPRVWQSLTNSQTPVIPTQPTLIDARHIPIDGTTLTIDQQTGFIKAGSTTVTLNGVATANASFYAPISVGNANQYLRSNGSGAPVWQTPGSVASGNNYLVTGGTVHSHFLETVDNVTKIKSSLIPDLYIGTTRVHTTHSTAETVYGVNGITSATAQTNNDPALLHWEANGGGTGIPAWVFNGNLVVNGWASVGGVNAGQSGGGIVTQVWKSTSDLERTFSQYDNDTFNAYVIKSLHTRISALEASPGGGATINLNGVDTSAAAFYAPIVSGSANQYLVSSGANAAPVWRTPGSVASGNAYLVTGGTVYSHFLESDKIKSSLLPDMYIGRTKTHSNQVNEVLLGINGISGASSYSASETTLIEYKENGGGTGIGAWVFNGNVVINGWASVGGVNSGSVDVDPLLTVWRSLTNNSSLASYGRDTKISSQHIDLPVATSSSLGMVQADGSSITISNGVISGFAGGGLNGLTAPRKIIVCTTIPQNMEADAIYMKVEQSA